MKIVQLDIEGMTCQHCSGRVQKALESVPGAREAQVDHEAGKGSVQVEDGVEVAPLLTAVEDAGYRAREPDPVDPES